MRKPTSVAKSIGATALLAVVSATSACSPALTGDQMALETSAVPSISSNDRAEAIFARMAAESRGSDSGDSGSDEGGTCSYR